jgi:hypothetical protein
MIMVTSLKNDHDLNLKNDYLQKSHTSYYESDLEPHINWSLVNRDEDNWHSIHGPGLPLLILPGMIVSERLGALPIMLGFALIAVVSGVVLAKQLVDRRYAFIAGVMLTLSIPFLSLSGYVFPDLILGALIAVIFGLIINREKKFLKEVVIGILAALLVWIHVKTTLIATSFVLIETIIIMRSPKNDKSRIRRLVGLFSPFILLLLILQIKFYQWFGVLTPNGIYQGNTQLFQLSPFKTFLGHLFDPTKGLLILSPIWFTAFIGILEWYKRNKNQFLLVLFLVFPSFSIQATFADWAGGWSPPSRYLLQFLPLLLPTIALGLERMFANTKLRVIAFSLILVQILITIAYIALRTPWSYAGEASPFLTRLYEKFNLTNLPTVFFDSRADPNLAGVLIILTCLGFVFILYLLYLGSTQLLVKQTKMVFNSIPKLFRVSTKKK